MDQNFQTSFIPKRPLAEDRAPRPKSVSVFLFLATILFIASLAGAGFVFFYKSSLSNQVTQMKADLQKAESAFEGDFIQQLQQTDKRINAASQVLASHVAVSPIFAALSQSALKSIQFTKFAYTLTGAGATSQIVVTMSGVSQSYTAIALESGMLTQNKYIKNPVFSDLTLNDQGQVLFSLQFSIDPQYVLYSQVLSRNGATAAAAGPQTVPSQQGTTTGGQQPAADAQGAGPSIAFPSAGQ